MVVVATGASQQRVSSGTATNATVPVTYGTTAFTNINSGLVANATTGTDTLKLGASFITTTALNANRSFNAVNIAWDRTSPVVELSDIAVVKLA